MNHFDNKTTMVSVSFVLALISIATFQIFFISLPCASLSIILALISRGDGQLLPRAKAALACSIAASALTTTVTVVSVVTVMNNPELRAEVEQIYNYYTDPETGTGDSSDSSVNGQDLLRDILSGKYREDRQKNSSSQTVPGVSGDSLPDTSPQDDGFAARNGGPLI